MIRELGRPGDLGWVVLAHGEMYAEEYGFDERFEGLVARIVADYAAGHDAERENAWIAEVDGERAGCVFCVDGGDGTAVVVPSGQEDFFVFTIVLVERHLDPCGDERGLGQASGVPDRAGERDASRGTSLPVGLLIEHDARQGGNALGQQLVEQRVVSEVISARIRGRLL